MNIHCLKKHYIALKLRVLTSDLFPNPRIFFLVAKEHILVENSPTKLRIVSHYLPFSARASSQNTYLNDRFVVWYANFLSKFEGYKIVETVNKCYAWELCEIFKLWNLRSADI